MAAVHEALADRVRSGDHDAWVQLWEYLRPQIYSTLGRLLKDIPGMEPEDVLGWTMAEAWRLVQSHDPLRSGVATYVISSLRGRVQNLRRDAVARGRSILLRATRPTDDHDPLEVLDASSLRPHCRAEVWADIDLALMSIPLGDPHRAVVETVRRFPDSSVSEVARLANVREDEAHRFLRGVGPAIAKASRRHLTSHRRGSAPHKRPYLA